MFKKNKQTPLKEISEANLSARHGWLWMVPAVTLTLKLHADPAGRPRDWKGAPEAGPGMPGTPEAELKHDVSSSCLHLSPLITLSLERTLAQLCTHNVNHFSNLSKN